MSSTEGREHLPALPLAPAVSQPQRRLRLGRTEAAVVRVLLAQRERYCQSNGTIPLCLSLAVLAEQTHLPPENLLRTISRVNAKLPALELTITHLRSGLGPLGYALFRLTEVWVW